MLTRKTYIFLILPLVMTLISLLLTTSILRHYYKSIMKNFEVIIVLVMVKFCFCQSIEEKCEEQFHNVIKTDVALELNIGKPSSLYLLENNKFSIELNNKFVAMLEHYEVHRIPAFCPGDDVLATVISQKKFGINVVNLAVIETNFDEKYLNSKGLDVVATTFIRNITACVRDNTTKVVEIDDENYTSSHTIEEYEMCSPKVVATEVATAKIFSNSIKNHPSLYHILVDFQEKSEISNLETIPYLSIIACIDKKEFMESDMKILKEYSRSSIIIVDNCTDIEKYSKHNILAALAPKPLEHEDGTSIPVIFYESTQLLPKHKMTYPNSITLHPNYFETLKYGTIEYFKRNKWNRIAVVSDDSPDSEKFEENLHEIFNKYKILNTIKSCIQKYCNFDKVLKNLQEADVKVIIANIDVKYANKLVETAYKLGMTSIRGFIWIWRDWPFSYDLETSALGDVYSMHITPSDELFYISSQPRIRNLNKAMQTMNDIHNKVVDNKENELNIIDSMEKLNREVYQDTETKLSTEKNTFQIRKINQKNYYERPEIICKFLVSHPLTEESFEYQFMAFPPFYRPPCMSGLTNYDFYEPCDDKYIIIELLVLALFLITGLVIYIFFNNLKRNRYMHL